ncbi:MAG: CDP-alcohol phosphatidyltransferase family protein [Isosphaeraceae bacterium]|nr:CDP-alcohol phosphatidyltransferase family protein [Isosphaeraceae bacterium]
MSADPAEPAEERPGLVRAVPNLLTSARLVLGVAFPFLPAGSRWAALLAVAATEFLDGQVARLLRVPSATGRILDPIADKIFVVSVLATLMWERTVAPWQLLLVLSRDILVTAGALWVASRRGPSALRRMPPSLLGKSATGAQFLFLLAAVASHKVDAILLLITSALSLAAGIDYVMRFR